MILMNQLETKGDLIIPSNIPCSLLGLEFGWIKTNKSSPKVNFSELILRIEDKTENQSFRNGNRVQRFSSSVQGNLEKDGLKKLETQENGLKMICLQEFEATVKIDYSYVIELN